LLAPFFNAPLEQIFTRKQVAAQAMSKPFI